MFSCFYMFLQLQVSSLSSPAAYHFPSAVPLPSILRSVILHCLPGRGSSIDVKDPGKEPSSSPAPAETQPSLSPAPCLCLYPSLFLLGLHSGRLGLGGGFSSRLHSGRLGLGVALAPGFLKGLLIPAPVTVFSLRRSRSKVDPSSQSTSDGS